MKKGVNIFNVILIIVVVIYSVLSFFPCIKQFSESSFVLDDGWKAIPMETGETYASAKWIVLILSVIQIVLLKFSNRWVRDIRETLSLISALLTTVWPIYLMLKFPGYFGNDYLYVWNVLGYIVLVLSWIIFLYSVVLLRIVEKKTKAQRVLR